MRTLPKWVDKVQDSEKTGQSIYDLTFSPDGAQLIVASGHHVLVYDSSDGSLIQLLKGHKDKVHTVSYAQNGEKFATGSADKTVIIWSNKLEGLLKYSHNDSVQCVAFNPLGAQLASCALSDFAFWSAEQKAVQKHKTGVRINACSWTNDGQYLALALNNGTVSIRNKSGEEKTKIERPGAIWAVCWSTSKDDPGDILCVTDWTKTLSFYTLGGKLVGKERGLGFNALRVRYFPKGDFILVGGLNRCCQLVTREGIKLGMIGERQEGWVWCCEADPTGNYVAMGCEDGTIAFYQLVFNMVHGLHKERYAYRENMTDVIIQHLITEQKVRIKCRDLIKKIAIYTDRLAVQLPERVVIYELYSKDTNDMHYRAKEKIAQKLDCSLLVVCANHLVVCRERTLRSALFSGGEGEKSWTFESPIRYIKNIGGPPGREGMLLGLKSGEVWEVRLDNVHPLLKVKVNEGVRCLDLSHLKRQLAVVDETGLLQVFKLDPFKPCELLFQEHEANSVAFNTIYEEMLGFSGGSALSIKVGDFPAHAQQSSGFVVGMCGSKVFCLNGFFMSTLEMPLSIPMYQFIEKKMFLKGYEIACLGVPDGDWEALAHAALENFDFDVARLSFVKLQDITYLELIQKILEQYQKGDFNREVIMGDLLAFKGKFKEAARCYQKSGNSAKALTMYTDLRMFDEAQEFLGAKDNGELIRQKADWARNINEFKAAAEMYLSIGQLDSAIDIYAEQEWTEQLLDLARKLDTKSERASLDAIARHLKRLNQPEGASEIYLRIGDSAAVLRLHVEAKEWAQAFAILDNLPQYTSMVYVPYAQWLAENDKFVQAQKAFHKAGESEEAFKVFRQLTGNAVEECRFDDAGFYHWIISRQYLDLAKQADNKREWCLEKFRENERLAQAYYAYDTVHKYLEEPFTSYMPEALFNISRFLQVECTLKKPPGISLFAINFTLAKQARRLGANKLAKQTFDKLATLLIPKKFQEQVEIATIASRGRPFNDPEELLQMCYRCSCFNPLTSTQNACVNCEQPFIYSFVSFEVLPLIEFYLEEGVSDEEALRLIQTPRAQAPQQDYLQVEDNPDPFVRVNPDKRFEPIVLSRDQLIGLEVGAVHVAKWPPPLKFRYFKNILPELHVATCKSCFKAFHVDDFELQLLQKGFCPFCRVRPGCAGVNMDDSGGGEFSL